MMRGAWPPMRIGVVALLVSAAVAGCLDGGAPDDDGAVVSMEVPQWRVDPGFIQSHDHDAVAGHGGIEGFEAVAYHNLQPGTDGRSVTDRGPYGTTEIIVKEDTAYVGWAGAPWALSVVDVSDAATPVLLGALALSGAWTMDVAVDHSGDWAFLALYNGLAVGSVFDTGYALSGEVLPTGPAGPGVLAVDLRDKTAPRSAGFMPIHGLGPHTAVYHAHENGNEYVFANKAEGGIPGNGIVVLEVVFTPVGQRAFQQVAFFTLDPSHEGEFPHDVDVAKHPVTGQTLLYAAYWNKGLVVVDVSDPPNPVLVSETLPPKDEVQFHDVHPFPRLVDGRHYTITTPEIPTGAHTGHMRLWDTTDPANPEVVHRFELPGGYVVESEFDFSPHNFVFLRDGRVAWAHGHGGVWLVDWFDRMPDGTEVVHDFVAEGFAVPVQEGATMPSWSPLTGIPWVWGVGEASDGTVWVADISSGLFGYRPPAAT